MWKKFYTSYKWKQIWKYQNIGDEKYRKSYQQNYNNIVVSNLRSETKSSRFEHPDVSYVQR